MVEDCVVIVCLLVGGKDFVGFVYVVCFGGDYDYGWYCDVGVV